MEGEDGRAGTGVNSGFFNSDRLQIECKLN